jgi:ElaB/YqjD/DUF883 family membrane-anchored ribosome-binding protein
MKELNVEKIKNGYPEISAINNDLKALKTDVSDLARHVADDGLGNLSAKADKEYKRLQQLGQKIEERIVNNPAQSLAIAFAGGVVASILLGGRR